MKRCKAASADVEKPDTLGLDMSLLCVPYDIHSTILDQPIISIVLRSVDLWIKGSVKSRAFLLRCDASSPPPGMKGMRQVAAGSTRLIQQGNILIGNGNGESAKTKPTPLVPASS